VTDGRCKSLTPTEVGVRDLGPNGQVSARLTGSGCSYNDFVWEFDANIEGNPGTIPNSGQSITCKTQAPTGTFGLKVKQVMLRYATL